ncbi:MAG: orotidine-5'-phosphate decarboxylase [Nitrospirae bacterium]|nr:orotidine-5'-phosphate decarboxylase [Nitrospirota bacterium]MBF0590653.1 orotidine-5'-phosphate decarboxylase [Nitrospirota bacterium]
MYERIRDRLAVALDVDTLLEAGVVVEALRDYVGLFKVGLQLFTGEGARVIGSIKGLGGKVFLDLKFHDIPNTVAAAARVVTAMGVDVFNVHACGGSEMMQAAVEATSQEAIRRGIARPTVLAVTVLTSINDDILSRELVVGQRVGEQVVHLARLAKGAGVDGVVASPREVGAIREACGGDFTILTPGIRPLWSAGKDDQKRITTPKEAIALGANYIVVGRPILRAGDMVEATRRILDEMAEAPGMACL